jgi:glycosyltransferase involved in cell wall biosynthesis
MTSPLRVLYVGSYKPTYPRNKIIIEGLRKNGASVVECNEPGRGWSKYVHLALRLFRLRGTYDVMLVGFPGQEVMFVARLFASAPIVFDVFTSHYMGYIIDRAYYAPGSFRAKIYRFLDRWSCLLADAVILDTQAHIDYFVKEFDLPRKRFHRVFLGANADLHRPRLRQGYGGHARPFTVLFWGGFIPLQGTEYITAAANVLRHDDIRFVLVGDGQHRQRDMHYVRESGLTNVEFPGKVSDERLIEYIRDVDICLGAFGGGIKTDITIQNKIFESLASRKPIITARTTAITELLTDGIHCLLCNPADPADLARAIVRLRDDPALRATIAENGYQLFRERLTEERIGKDLYDMIAAL